MSKLVSMIRASIDTQRSVVPGIVAVSSEFQAIDGNIATRYRIGAKVVAEAYITDRQGPEALHAAVESAQRSVIEEVFGEFRKPLADIEQALWGRDIDKARTLVDALRRQMFLPSNDALKERS